MRSFLALLAIALCLASVYADCDDAKSNEEEGVKSWFKNVGCQIKKGASDLSDSAKPWAEKIGNSAKDFGSTVADKYDQLKHKLTDDSSQSQDNSAPSNTYIVNAPTEKIPLAPLNGEARPAAPQAGAAPGEQTDVNAVTPESVDQRFLFQLNECPKGQVLDHKKNCRPQ